MKKKDKKEQSIVIYKDRKGNVELKADVSKETIWATINQIGDLFDVQKAAVSKHLKNIFKSGELLERATVSKMETVQMEGNRKIKRVLEFYNLDAIIAVGYRVNSKKATQFRVWATKILRDYIIKGAAINTDRIKRLHEKGIKDLRSKIEFIQNTIKKRELDKSEIDSLLSVIKDYTNSWTILKEYDDGDISVRKSRTSIPWLLWLCSSPKAIRKKKML